MARPSQKEKILQFLEQEYRKNGYSPSIASIAARLGLSSRSNIHRQLQQLAREGRVVNRGGRYIPFAADTVAASEVEMVPLLGTVAAGRPILAEENLMGYVAYLPRFGDGGEHFALRVKGDSMVGANILDGDIVFVKKTPEAENGEIVVAILGDEATVKTFYREQGHVRLQPQNPEYAPILVENVAILGRVVASMRYF